MRVLFYPPVAPKGGKFAVAFGNLHMGRASVRFAPFGVFPFLARKVTVGVGEVNCS